MSAAEEQNLSSGQEPADVGAGASGAPAAEPVTAGPAGPPAPEPVAAGPAGAPAPEPVTAADELAPSEEDVMEALSNVIDPELGLDFVELGLIYGVEVSEGNVHVTFTLTTPGCPIGPQVNEQIEEFVGELDGVSSISSEMVFTPAWSPEMMSEDAKFALGF